jgi:hypothetical protein
MNIRRILANRDATFATGVATLLMLVVESPLCADVVVDQSNVPTKFTGAAFAFGSPFPQYEAQTFTVGVTGTLDHINLPIFENGTAGNLFVEIWPTSGGSPAAGTTSSIVSVQFLHGTLPTDQSTTPYTSVDFSSFQLAVTQGEALAIVLRTDTQGQYGWQFGAPTYTGGDPYYQDLAGWHAWSSTGSPSFDFAFQTYVATPEPSSLGLGGVGSLLALVVGWGRRRLRRGRLT